MAETSQAPAASTQATDRPVYELGFHLVPTVGDEGVSPALEAIRKALGGAELINEGFPRKMTLAYQVERATQGKREKYTESYFGHIKFATEREALPALQAALTAMSQVLRFLIVETVREEVAQKQRAVFVSDRLEGKTLEKPAAVKETSAEVSQEELDKSIDAITS